VITYYVAVQTGHKLVPGGATGAPNRMATAQLTPMRLNGSTSRVLVESAFAVDNVPGPTASASLANNGPLTSASLGVDRPASAPSFESVCSTATKSTFILRATVDAATASNYVMPWPPEPYAERETASMGGFRLFYTVVPCAPTRSAAPAAEAQLIKP
jgi:hypothetical protein